MPRRPAPGASQHPPSEPGPELLMLGPASTRRPIAAERGVPRVIRFVRPRLGRGSQPARRRKRGRRRRRIEELADLATLLADACLARRTGPPVVKATVETR